MSGAPSTVFGLSVTQTEALRVAVRNKISKIDAYADASLTDYVMVLLANRHGQEKVMSELEDFLSPMLVEEFVQWLFNKCEELSKEKPAVGERSVLRTTSENANIERGGQRLFERALRKVEPSRMDKFEETKSNEMLDSRGKRFGATSRRSRSPRQRGSRSKSPGRKGQNRRRGSRSPAPVVKHYNSLNSRLGEELESRGGRRHGSRRRGFPEEDVLDARELLSGRRRTPNQRTVRRLDEARMDISDRSPLAVEEMKKTRCSYWPNCKAGDSCPYAHPSEACQHFPNCVFGDKCVNLHPAIPCKFQDRCTNPNCNYQHSSPATMGKAFATANNPFIPPSAIPCRFYPNCKNTSCPFLHPSNTACKFGEKCLRPACPFSHPEGRVLACKAFVNAPCRYGKNCAKTDCPFQHITSPMHLVAEPSSLSSMEPNPPAEAMI